MGEEIVKNETALIADAVKICNQRDILKNEIEEYEDLLDTSLPSLKEFKKMAFAADAPRTFFLILSVILGFGLACLMAIIFKNIPPDTAGALSVPLMFLIYQLVFKQLFYLAKKGEFEEYEQGLIAAEEEMPALRVLHTEKKQELAALEQRMLNEEVCIIPPAYWDHANQLYFLIRNKRAHDLESAINTFEDIMHKTRMESMAQESLAYNELAAINSEIMAQNSAIAAENSRIAARNTGISAVFSIATYLKD